MDERSLLTNGHFYHRLDGWIAAAGAVYSAGDGDAQYGVVEMPVGASIRQAFAVDRARRYTLHLATKAGAATVTITDGDGSALPGQPAPGAADVWTESSLTFGLAPGTTYTLTVSNAGAGTILVDDLWLWWVPKTRLDLAGIVARKLGALATDAELSSSAFDGQSEGSYTDAIDAALRSVGAIDPESDTPDIRGLTAGLLDSALQQIERGMLERLQRHYATFVDTKEGPLDQKLSQIGAALKSFTGGSAGGGRGGPVVVRRLDRSTPDYEITP